ncbi:MAG: rod-binding protein [Bdellovibrio sp.]|nr:rod-binding protein [Bdellovibrio sp.]
MSEITKLNSAPMDSIQAKPLSERKNKVTDEKLREVSEMYEKHFIRQMMKEMRATVHEGGLVQQNNGEKLFQDQLDDQYAGEWGKAGGIGLADMIHKQLLDRYGEQFGLKEPIQKPSGPLKFDAKSTISTVRSGEPTPLKANAELKPENEITNLKIQPDATTQKTAALHNPWAGVLLDKKYLEMDQMQYRIKHDNGLESLITTRGSGLAADSMGAKLSAGDEVKAGQQLGWLDATSPLFWTIKPNKVGVSE